MNDSPMGFMRAACFGVVLFAAVPWVSFGQEPPTEYEVTARVIVFPRHSPKDAVSVPAEAAATAHAGLIVSHRIVGQATDKYRLGELQSIRSDSRAEAVRKICAGVAAVGKPSTELPGVAIVELRSRSTNLNDAMTIAKALCRIYEDSLDRSEPNPLIEIEQAIRTRDRLQTQRDEFRRLGKGHETADAERAIRDADDELTVLKQKANGGRLILVVIQEPESAKVVKQP